MAAEHPPDDLTIEFEQFVARRRRRAAVLLVVSGGLLVAATVTSFFVQNWVIGAVFLIAMSVVFFAVARLRSARSVP